MKFEGTNDLKIDLAGLEEKWGKGASICAVCGFNFDSQDVDEEHEHQVPLLLFRGEGKETEMLTLCWGCTEVRMQRKEFN